MGDLEKVCEDKNKSAYNSIDGLWGEFRISESAVYTIHHIFFSLRNKNSTKQQILIKYENN